MSALLKGMNKFSLQITTYFDFQSNNFFLNCMVYQITLIFSIIAYLT